MALEEAHFSLASRPALIVIDMQNGFLHKDGFMTKIGLDVSSCSTTIAPIKSAIAAAHKAKVPVIFTRVTYAADYSNAGLLPLRRPKIVEVKGLVEGSWDNAIVDELLPLEEKDIVVDKTRYSAFFKTNLLDVLREKSIEQILLCGVCTNVCVEGTGRDAYANDIEVVVLEDGTGAVTKELHEGALDSMRYGMGPVVSTAEVVKALEGRA